MDARTLCVLLRWKLNCYKLPYWGCMWARRWVLPSQVTNSIRLAVVCHICLLLGLPAAPRVCVCACVYKMDMTQQYELEGWFRLVHRANGTIMDIRGLRLPGICIWVFCNLTLLQKDASAPPVIYHSIKPILYYNLIHLPPVQTKAMSATSANLSALSSY